MTDRYKSYNISIQYFHDITVSKLKENVCIFLLQNKNNKFNSKRTFVEYYDRHIKEAYVTYEEFCGNIITNPSYKDNTLSILEQYAIEQLQDNHIIYTIIGEREAFSKNFYLLDSFINDKDMATNFVTNYKLTNPLVEVQILTSEINKPTISTISNLEDFDPIEPEPIFLDTILRHFFNKQDEQIRYYENNIHSKINEYKHLKQINMESDIGLFHNIVRKFKELSPHLSEHIIFHQMKKRRRDIGTVDTTAYIDIDTT